MELLASMYKITKTTSKGEIETIESNLSLSQASHLFNGLHRIKSSARRYRKLGVSQINKSGKGCRSFSCVDDENDLYVTSIYQMDVV